MFYASSNLSDSSKAKDVGALLDELCSDTAKQAAAAAAAAEKNATNSALMTPYNKSNHHNRQTHSNGTSTAAGTNVTPNRTQPPLTVAQGATHVSGHSSEHTQSLTHDIFEDLGLRAPSVHLANSDNNNGLNSNAANNLVSRLVNPQLPVVRIDDITSTATSTGGHPISATNSYPLTHDHQNGINMNGGLNMNGAVRTLEALAPLIRVVHPKFGGQASFKSFREAALCILLMDGTPLLDFIKWAAEMKAQIEKDPRCVPKNEFWRFFLLHDLSLAGPYRPSAAATSSQSSVPVYESGVSSSATSAAAMGATAAGKAESIGVEKTLPQYSPVNIVANGKSSRTSSSSSSRRDSLQKSPIVKQERTRPPPPISGGTSSQSAPPSSSGGSSNRNASFHKSEEYAAANTGRPNNGEGRRSSPNANGDVDAAASESYTSQRRRSPTSSSAAWRNRASGSDDDEDDDDDEEEEVIERHHKRRHIRRHIAR